MFESLRLEAMGPAAPWAVCRLTAVVDAAQGDAPVHDVRLGQMLAAAPSAQMLAALAEYDADDVNEHDRVVLLKLWERVACWVASKQQRAIVDVAGPAPATSADDWAERKSQPRCGCRQAVPRSG